MVISKKTMIFQDSRGGSNNVQGAGVNLFITIETYLTAHGLN